VSLPRFRNQWEGSELLRVKLEIRGWPLVVGLCFRSVFVGLIAARDGVVQELLGVGKQFTGRSRGTEELVTALENPFFMRLKVGCTVFGEAEAAEYMSVSTSCFPLFSPVRV
jgi:hypothetical protein